MIITSNNSISCSFTTLVESTNSIKVAVKNVSSRIISQNYDRFVRFQDIEVQRKWGKMEIGFGVEVRKSQNKKEIQLS